jgi:hypothetical protein
MTQTSQVFLSRFRCQDEDSARRLVNVLLVAGLLPELHAPRLPGDSWEVVAAAELVPTPDNVADLRRDMESAARRARVSFEGCDPER